MPGIMRLSQQCLVQCTERPVYCLVYTGYLFVSAGVKVDAGNKQRRASGVFWVAIPLTVDANGTANRLAFEVLHNTSI